MNRLRVASSVLFFASMLTLAACGEDDAATTAGSTPPASVPASAPSSPPPAPADPAKDKKLCTAAASVGETMKKELIATLQTGDTPSPAATKKILAKLDKRLTTLAAGGDGAVATALKQMGVEASKAAAAADPVDAAANPAFEKAGADLTDACKAVGVTAGF